jgi:PelA/Pel-15E family pectate lyase
MISPDQRLTRRRFVSLTTIGSCLLAQSWTCLAAVAANEPARAAVEAALKKAATFYAQNCSNSGGYAWRHSRDLRLSEGEGETSKTSCWVQPPGTPSVGDALLDVYEVTGDQQYLAAAKAAANVLVRGQRHSGGWYYSVELDPAKRTGEGYRDNPNHRPPKSGRDLKNLTMLDDDTSPAAVRFLMRLDKSTGFKDPALKNTIAYALKSILLSQYPVGAFTHNYDRFPTGYDAKEYPVLKATYPATWSRTWPNDWTGHYHLNDNISGNVLATMLLAHEVYGDERYLAAAKRCGDFFLLAQMPDPQPAWGQQYDVKMQPVWERKFEPPAISGLESQYALESLLLLYRKTGDAKYLEPFPKALAYLKKSRLKDGRLARFYEFRTNKPLCFIVEGKVYNLSYDFSQAPDHYGFIVESRLDRIEAEYNRLKNGGDRNELPAHERLQPTAVEVKAIIASMDPRGAWIDARSMKGFKKASPEGVIQSETFIKNTSTLCHYLRATK